MNTAERTYEHDKLIAELISCNCYESESELTEYDKDIGEINEMIRYFIDVGDRKEVASWRRYLTKVKTEKRRVKARIMESNQRKEIALA